MGGCRHSIHICLTPDSGGLALARNSNLKKNIDILGVSTFLGSQNLIFWGLNGVVVGRHGDILKDNEAMGSGKVSGCLPDLWDTIEYQNMTSNIKKSDVC